MIVVLESSEIMSYNTSYIKNIIIFILLFYFAVLAIGVNLAYTDEADSDSDYARITDVDYKAVLYDDATNGNKLVVTERLTYDIHAESIYNLFWELWRDLPEDTVDGLKVHYKVNYVKEINDDNTETIYTESPKLYWYDSDYTSEIYGPGKWYHSEGPYNEDVGLYECVFFYVDGLYREQVVFEVQYEIYNVALKYNDVSELYLTLYSEETIRHLDSFNAQILIPNKDMPEEGNYEAYTYGTNSHVFPFTESDTLNPGYHTFSFSLDEDTLEFEPYNQYIEFNLLTFGSDRHSITDYALDNIYSHEDYLEEAREAQREYEELPIKAERNKKIIFTACIIASGLVIIYAIKKKKKILNQYTFYEPQQKMDYYRDIPTNLDPYFVANLVFIKGKRPENIDGHGYSALLLSLVRKGYIELVKIDHNKDWDNKNIKINILYNPFILPKEEPNINYLGIPKNLPETINMPYVPIFPTMAGHTSENVRDSIIDVERRIQNNNNAVSSNPFEEHANNVYKLEEVIKADTVNKLTVGHTYDKKNSKGKVVEDITQNEVEYYNLLIRHATDNSITMDKFQDKIANDYDNTDTFVTNLENSIVNIGVDSGYFQKANYTEPVQKLKELGNALIILGILIMIVGNMFIYSARVNIAYGAFFILGFAFILCAIYLKYDAKKYILLTQLGEDEYAKWHALYKFLDNITAMDRRTVVELPLWEKYLVYATAFGISHKVVKALKIFCPNYELVVDSSIDIDYCSSSRFRTNSSSFSRSTRSASYTSRSGGSYYGGGGRGGGGGGGGH